MPKTKEQIKEEIEEGKREKSPYTKTGEEVLTEDEDEMHIEEQGFMEGYRHKKGEKEVICQNCKKVLGEDVVEKEIGGEVFRFCCSQCATEYEKKRSK